MNRRQLALVVIVNALVSLVIALAVVWAIESRRPDLEELAALYTPLPQAILAATPTAISAQPLLTPVVVQGSVDTPATPTASLTGDEQVYVVQAGDSLLGIATRFRITVDEIVKANSLSNPDFVFSGQRLVIPVQGEAATNAGQEAEVENVTDNVGVQISAVQGAGDLATESVLLVNESNAALNVEGWKLERENGPAYTFSNLPLFPGGSIRLHSTTGANSSIDLFWGQSAAVWQSGSVARLINAQSVPVHSYTVP